MASMVETIPTDDRMVIEARIKSRGIKMDLGDLTLMQVVLYDRLSSTLPPKKSDRKILIENLKMNINSAIQYNRSIAQ